MLGRAIYLVADSTFFLGAVAAVNSLRLIGHQEPILVLDCGLEPEQRAMLERETTLLDAPSDDLPYLLKLVAPLERPAGVMLLIDADVVVTRSLEPLFAGAASGRVVAFEDALPTRFDARWSDLLALGAPLRRQPYVNAGVLALPHELGIDICASMDERRDRIDPQRTMGRGGTPQDPFYFPDQDLLNAILASEIDADRLEILEHRLTPHPPFPGVRLCDRDSLDCAYDDGVRPFVLHHIQAKPWLVPVRQTVYSQLLRRLLVGNDLPLRVPSELIPLRLREGTLASIDRRRATTVARWRRARGRIGLRRRLAGRRSKT